MITENIKKEASKHLQNDNWVALAECCMQLMQLEPKDHRHCLNLAKCFGKQGQVDKQLATLTIGERKFPKDRYAFATHKIVVLANGKRLSDLTEYFVTLASDEISELQELIITIPNHISNEFILGHLVSAMTQIRNQDVFEGLARLLSIRKCFKEAIALLEQVEKQTAKTWIYRGGACANLGQIKESTKAFHEAEQLLQTDQERSLFYRLKSDALLRSLNHQEAYQVLRKACDLNPNDKMAHQAAFTQLLYIDDPTQHCHIKTHARAWEKNVAKSQKGKRRLRINHAQNTLRIGFVSHGFRIHPVGWMIAGLLCELRKHGSIEVFIFDLQPQDDYIAKTIRAVCTQYIDSSSYYGNALYDSIASTGIEILIDCDGFQASNRLDVICQKPAPILVKWVGGLGSSMHLKAFDYLISDPLQTPENLESMFSEDLMIMPDCYVTYTPPPYELDLIAPPCDTNQFVTFGSFNNAVKITQLTINTWSSVLLNTPNSRLLLKDKLFDSEDLREQVLQRFALNGIDQSQISFQGGTDHIRHLLAHNEVDISLDPIPYSGGLCTLESLYMGVPVVALAGTLLSHRHSVTHLTQARAAELVATSIDEYISITVDLAHDSTRLDHYRSTLRDQIFESPLYDHAKFASHFVSEMKKAATKAA